MLPKSDTPQKAQRGEMGKKPCAVRRKWRDKGKGKEWLWGVRERKGGRSKDGRRRAEYEERAGWSDATRKSSESEKGEIGESPPKVLG